MRGRAVMLAVGAVLATAAPAAAQDQPRRLGVGEAVFWSGPSGASCGSGCSEYALDVAPEGGRLRVAIDHPKVGDTWSVELEDPGGRLADSVSTAGGIYSAEAFADAPAAGRWVVRVREDSVVDRRVRVRAKLEAPEPPPGVPPVLEPPNLQPLPPYELNFMLPLTNGAGAGAPEGIETPGGRLACHPEEVVEEGAQRCLRMGFGVRNTGRGPMQLFFEDPGSPADQTLYQRLRYSDGTYVDRVAGLARFHRTHAHHHHDEAISLTLLRVTDPLAGRLEPAGAEHRKGFAHRDELMREWGHFYPTWERFGFGLSAGWGDYYEWDRPGNYIDFGLNADGLYVLRMVADPGNGIVESNEADNTGYSYIEVVGTEVRLLESGRGTDPWDRCRIVMPAGPEPDVGLAAPPRPADCPLDTIDPDPPQPVAAPNAPAAKPPASKRPGRRAAARKRCARRTKGEGGRAKREAGRRRAARCRRAAQRRRTAARREQRRRGS